MGSGTGSGTVLQSCYNPGLKGHPLGKLGTALLKKTGGRVYIIRTKQVDILCFVNYP